MTTILSGFTDQQPPDIANSAPANINAGWAFHSKVDRHDAFISIYRRIRPNGKVNHLCFGHVSSSLILGKPSYFDTAWQSRRTSVIYRASSGSPSDLEGFSNF